MGALVARCFDSNVLIDWLNGVEAAGRELRSADVRIVSIMTWIEVLAGARSDAEARGARKLFREDFRVVPVDSAIAERVLMLRRDRRLKLIDATIHATALEAGVQLSTRNTKDFSEADPTIRVPYRL
jgi:predicted nucleic acid-binding protein